MAKYGMSMCVLGMSEEFKPLSIAVNALWPRTGELNKLIRICYIEELLNMRNSCSLKQNCFLKRKITVTVSENILVCTHVPVS